MPHFLSTSHVPRAVCVKESSVLQLAGVSNPIRGRIRNADGIRSINSLARDHWKSGKGNGVQYHVRTEPVILWSYRWLLGEETEPGLRLQILKDHSSSRLSQRSRGVAIRLEERAGGHGLSPLRLGEEIMPRTRHLTSELCQPHPLLLRASLTTNNK